MNIMTDKPHWSHLRRGGGNNGFRCGRSYAHEGLKKPQMSANASLATSTADAVGKADDDDDEDQTRCRRRWTYVISRSNAL